jgi:drug/metabolite transporter (DMT)-like permease
MALRRPQVSGASLALAAALMWGTSAPVAKMLLLAGSEPLILAALLYLGAGLGLALIMPVYRRWVGQGRGRASEAPAHPRETPLRRADFAIGAAAVAMGGVAAPVLLMFGLERVSGVTGSLLLNLEAPFTILIAVGVFREHLGWREVGAAILILAGAGLVGYHPGELRADWLGIAAVVGASLAWSIDSNLSQHLSLRDPVAVSRLKAVGGGLLTLLIGLGIGERLPRPAVAGAALLIGAFAYGISGILWLYSLRILGAARVAAYFATAPFLGALAAIPLLGERLGRSDLQAMILMMAGVALLLGERHAHEHAHEELAHDHAHTHDEHHRHDHPGLPGPVAEPHAHPHRHAPLTHSHPHVSDLHHRHRH